MKTENFAAPECRPGRDLIVGGSQLDAKARLVLVNGEKIPLSRREFDIIHAMLLNPEIIFTREKIMEEFWENSTAGRRSVDVYITKLREKLSGCQDFRIITVRGIGYQVMLR